MMSRCMFWSAITCLALAVAAHGQVAGGLLQNGSFEDSDNPCDGASGWTNSGPNGGCGTNGTTHPPAGGTAYDGNRYASSDKGDPNAGESSHITQVVNGLAVGDLRLIGAVTGSQNCGSTNHFARIHDGTDYNAAVIAEFVTGGASAWTNGLVDIIGTPTGTSATVSWGWDEVVNTCWNVVATHADAFVLTQESQSCPGEPEVVSVAPTYAPNSGPAAITVTGSNFDGSSQVILRRTGFTDVQATGESVNVGGTEITATLPLTGVAMGEWDIVVTRDLCNEAALPKGFVVATDALANGGFENGTVNWLQFGVSTAQNLLNLNSNIWLPSTGPYEGLNYGSIVIPSGTSMQFWAIYQYIAVAPGQEITITGQFSGGGRLGNGWVEYTQMRLYEGTSKQDTEDQIDLQNIFSRDGCPPVSYGDWVPATVTGTPTGGLVTLVILAGAATTDPAAMHIDGLDLTVGPPPAEVCDDGVDNDGDRRIDCQDEDCAAALGCETPPVEICDNGIDDDGNLKIDCDDEACADVCIEICGDGIDNDQDCDVDEDCEICDNEVDDNDDGLIDCDDPTCANDPACGEACYNGIDDDGNSLIDCFDLPACDNSAACVFCGTGELFADADQDGDVDQEDFGLLQVCITGLVGEGAPLPPTSCVCFDRDQNNEISQTDIAKFESCATGPGIAYDIQNLPAGCTTNDPPTN